MILWVVLLVGMIHCAVFLHLLLRFRSLKKGSLNKEMATFSVIVPVRNEAATIRKLVAQLLEMDYPKEAFEILVVDDSSEDNTRNKISDLLSDIQLTLIQLPEGVEGKKQAIELGIQHAKMDWIITTDGDCEVPTTWLKSFSEAIDDQTQLIVGPVRMEASNFLGSLQSFDFSILIGYAASLVSMGVPSMSNGANLCYRRRVFNELGGYNGNTQVPSGDDEFLLLKVVKRYPDSIRFNTDSHAVVSTSAKPDFRSLLNQRKRWLSKWTLHKNPRIVMSVLLTLIDNLLMITALIGLLIGAFPLWLFVVFIARWLIKGWFSFEVNQLLNGRTYWFSAIVYELLYPFYVVLLSFASIFGYYTWKGRRYR